VISGKPTAAALPETAVVRSGACIFLETGLPDARSPDFSCDCDCPSCSSCRSFAVNLSARTHRGILRPADPKGLVTLNHLLTSLEGGEADARPCLFFRLLRDEPALETGVVRPERRPPAAGVYIMVVFRAFQEVVHVMSFINR
jgi:hypothetical protein